MSRKFLFLLSTAIFTLSTILGVLIASDNFPHRPPLVMSMSGPTPIAVQNNLLLIHVDRLNATRPALRAAWIAGYFHSPNQSILTFYPLLSETDTQSAQANLIAAFSLNPDGSPGQAFSQAIATRGIKTSGFLVVDDQGIKALDEFFPHEESPILTATPSSELRSFDASCRYFPSRTSSQTTGRRFDWKAFYGHLHSNLSYSVLYESWDSMHDPSHPIRCEILP